MNQILQIIIALTIFLQVSDSALCVEEADVDEGAWGEAGLDWGGEEDF